MRKSELRSKLKDYDRLKELLDDDLKQIDRIRARYARLPEDIAFWQEKADETARRLEGLEAQLTKPLHSYSHRRIWRGDDKEPGREFSSRKAQAVYEARERLAWCQDAIDRRQAKLDAGPDDQLYDAHTRIDRVKERLWIRGRDLAQYAVFYAKQRRDVEVLWRQQEDGSYTPDGKIRVRVDQDADDEGREYRVTIEELARFLVKPHTKKATKANRVPEDKPRECKVFTYGADWVKTGADLLYKSLRGLATSDAVEILGCSVGLRGLRAYLREVKRGDLMIVSEDGDRLRVTAKVPGHLVHHSEIKHGAWVKGDYVVPAAKVVFKY